MVADPVNVATGVVPLVVFAEDRLAVTGAVGCLLPLPVTVVVLVRLLSVVSLAVIDGGSSPVACEADTGVSEDSLLDVAFTVCSLLDVAFTVCSPVDALAVAVGTKLGVLSDIDNGHILDVPDADAIEMVASRI